MTRMEIWLGCAAVALALQGSAGAAQGYKGEFRGDQEFEVTPGQRLRIELKHGGGSIELRGWDRDVVSIKASGGEEVEALETSQDASGVTVISRRDRRWKDRGDDLRIEVQVPRRFDFKGTTVGGGISIVGIEGRFEGQTMGGEIELSQLKGSVELTTMGGDIEVIDCEVDGSVSTMGGDVLIERVRGNLRGTSMGGQVRERNVTRKSGDSSGEEARIRSMGGDISIDDAPAGADLETMGGDIRVRDAKDHVRAQTMGGDIRIESSGGWVEATTMGGDVTVTLDGSATDGDRHVELTSMSGDITLEVPGDLSMDIEIVLVTSKRDLSRHQIRSDFPLEETTSERRRRRWDETTWEKRATGSVGGGKHRIRIETIHGNVVLRKRAS